MPSRLLRLAAPLALVAATALGGCAPATAADGRVPVVASFYPLAYAAEQVGGPHVRVTNLTKPGAEPHELELGPRDVLTVAKARVAVYEKGFQPAVDDAVAQQATDNALDVAGAAHLDLHLQGGTDPHFWLDPTRYAAVANAIADRLARVDPAHRADYAANARSFTTRLAALDTTMRQHLASCRQRQLVTSHSAFGYLARRYGFTQVGITGLTPDAEPSPSALAAVARLVRSSGVTTVYAETLASPAIADTVATETGAHVATLDPLEGLTAHSAGRDYFTVMQANLRALQAGQDCP
ncbi:metal ABC transporter substrate-binding protein [Oryzihumus sp.]|uniref:metal ABC transporter substrate-binding protein n=1 Tax=Oryzihumus sp. TaxID=1968903 RepID=UPI002EDA8BC5